MSVWWVEFIRLNYSQIKLICLIPKPHSLDLHLSISNGFVSSKTYYKLDDYDFDIINYPVLDGDVPRSTSYGVNISQLTRFARVSSHATDFNARNKF